MAEAHDVQREGDRTEFAQPAKEKAQRNLYCCLQLSNWKGAEKTELDSSGWCTVTGQEATDKLESQFHFAQGEQVGIIMRVIKQRNRLPRKFLRAGTNLSKLLLL